MTGVISGGWGYVAAAWGISLSILAIYAIAVNVNLARHRRAAERRDAADNVE